MVLEAQAEEEVLAVRVACGTEVVGEEHSLVDVGSPQGAAEAGVVVGRPLVFVVNGPGGVGQGHLPKGILFDWGKLVHVTDKHHAGTPEGTVLSGVRAWVEANGVECFADFCKVVAAHEGHLVDDEQ